MTVFGLHMAARRLWSFVLLLSLVAVACGPAAQPEEDGSGGGAISQPTSTTAGAAKDRSPEEKVGGTLRIAMHRPPTIWDPMLSESSPPALWATMLYPHLFVSDTGPTVDPNEHNPVPDLVRDWDVSEDGRVYTFHLRENARWGKEPPLNGRSITAEDVVFSLDRLRDVSVIRANFAPITDVEAMDEQTVKVTLEHPFAPLIPYLSDTSAIIVPPELVQEHGDLTRLEVARKVGGGPWLIESVDEGVKIIYKRNPDYYRSPLPYFERLEVFEITDRTAREVAFESRQVDILYGTDARGKETTAKAHPEVLWDTQGNAHNALYFNTRKTPWSDPRVREAIRLAIDWDAFIQARYAGEEAHYESPVRAYLQPWALPQDELRQLQPFDPTRAKQLLADAGYADGFDAGTWYAWPGGSTNVRDLEIIKDMLRRNLNITFTIQQIEYSQNLEILTGEEFDVMHVVYSRRYPEADQYIYPRLHSTGPLNYSGCNDQKLDQLLDDQRQAVDQQARLEIVHEIQRYFLNELNCMVMIPTTSGYYGWWPWVKDYGTHVGYFGRYDLLGAWLDEQLRDETTN